MTPSMGVVGASLTEGPGARRAREALREAVDTGFRCGRLAFEAEMVGNWRRAAEQVQTSLVLPEFRHEPTAWVAYAKLCARARGRQAAAEEALRQAVQLLADGLVPHTAETALEVDFMLACLLLDRGRHEEAIRVFRAWHKKDFQDSNHRFFLGLALFLAGEEEESSLLLESVAKPREWFQGLPDAAAVADKLKAFRNSDGAFNVEPYVACLERLLDFGLPSLIFTFIDQCGTLPEAALAREPVALIDAKALAVDRDYAAVIARLEPLLASGEASREAWRIAGDCHFHLQDYDRALQALNHAMSFQSKFEDPAIFVRLGHVLLLKKRWKQAREAFLKSIGYGPTAEAWSGVAYAEYRSEEIQMCYEALCEANLLDNERPDVWAQLALVHLRLDNAELADSCLERCISLGSPDCDELLVECSSEYARREQKPALAEAAARCALKAKESGQAHVVLADALALQGQIEKAVLEAQVALGLLADQPDQRRTIFDRALRWCEDLGDLPLLESLHAVQKLADRQHAERAESPG